MGRGEDGRWEMGEGRWEMGDGDRCRMQDAGVSGLSGPAFMLSKFNPFTG